MQAVKITPLEGNRHALDGGAMFGHVPKAIWSRYYTPDEKNRIELASRALLIEDDKGDHYLFDGTIGTILPTKEKERYGVQGEENQLLVSLEKAGLSPKDIRGVILSHLHFDHVGGIFSRVNDKLSLLFPQADHYLSQPHFERAKSPKIRERASFLDDVPPALLESRKLKLLNPGDKLPFTSEWFLSEGHTTGLMVVFIYAPHLVALPTDLVPGVPWAHLPITMGYDRFPEKGVEEKEKLLERVVKERGRLFLTHDPNFPFGTIIKTDRYTAVGIK